MTAQERLEQEQQTHEEALNAETRANGNGTRLSANDFTRNATGQMVFTNGEIVESTGRAITITLPKGRNPQKLRYSLDAKTGKYSVPKNRKLTYFSTTMDGQRLTVSLLIPIPQRLREAFHAQGVEKGLRMEPLEVTRTSNRIDIDE